jgi:hypothetical protein
MSNQLAEKKEIVKLEEKLGEGVAADFRAMPVKELEFKLLELSKHMQEIVTTQKEDEELQNAKDLVKELSAPYREQMGGNKLKQRFIHLLIKDKKLDLGEV